MTRIGVHEMKPAKSERWLVRAARDLAGGRVLACSLAVVPVGVVMGAVEVLLGSAIYLFLVRFGLLSGTDGARVPNAIAQFDPTVLLLSLGAAGMALRYLSQYLPEKAGEALNHRVRVRVAEALLSGYQERLHLSAQQISQVLGNLLPNSGGFFNAAAQLATSVVLLLVLLIGLLNLSPMLTGLSILAMLVFGSPFAILRPLAQRFANRVHAERSRFMKKSVTDAQNIYFLKISGANERELHDLREGSRHIARNYLLHAACAALSGSMPQFMAMLIVLVVVLVNYSWPVLQAGELVAFVYVLSRVANAITHGVLAATQVQFTQPFLADLIRTIGHLFPPECGPDETAGSRRLERIDEIAVRDLIVGRNEPLLPKLDFAVRRGEVLAVTGQSGLGKSTVLMTVMGMLPPLAGHVTWNGVPVDSLDPVALRRAVGYAGSEPYLFNGTVRDNLLLGADARAVQERELKAALEIARAEFVQELNGGLNYVLREGGEGISGGQKQRLALARAFLRRPEVLILDEAFANIDEATEADIMSNVRAQLPKTILIIVSHRSSILRFASRLLPLDTLGQEVPTI